LRGRLFWHHHGMNQPGDRRNRKSPRGRQSQGTRGAQAAQPDGRRRRGAERGPRFRAQEAWLRDPGHSGALGRHRSQAILCCRDARGTQMAARWRPFCGFRTSCDAFAVSRTLPVAPTRRLPRLRESETAPRATAKLSNRRAEDPFSVSRRVASAACSR
jgi:hypothetical protein